MGKGTVTPGRPFVWRIETTPDNPQLEVLCFGQHRILLNDITGLSSEDIRDRDLDGLILALMIFFVIGCALAFGVFDGTLNSRALIGTAFLGFLGYMGLSELPKLREQTFFRLHFTFADKPSVVFSSADRKEMDALLAALASR